MDDEEGIPELEMEVNNSGGNVGEEEKMEEQLEQLSVSEVNNVGVQEDVQMAEEEEDVLVLEETPSSSVAASGGSKRGRGRPRKKEALAETPSSAVSASGGSKRGRGRPRKDSNSGTPKRNKTKKKRRRLMEEEGSDEDEVQIIVNSDEQAMEENPADQYYKVEAIWDRRFKHGRLEYLVKWLGYPVYENTWEPRDNMLEECWDLVRMIDERFDDPGPSKPKKKKSSGSAATPGTPSTEPTPSTSSAAIASFRKTVTDSGGKKPKKSAGKGKERESDFAPAEQYTSRQASSSSSSKKTTPKKPTQKKTESKAPPVKLQNDIWNGNDSDFSTDSDFYEDEMELKDYGSRYRKSWDPDETPLCILGSTSHNNQLLYLVRLRPWPHNAKALELAEQDPYEGLNEFNCVIANSLMFNDIFPEMVISFYQDNLKLVDSPKNEASQVEAAATAALYHQYRKTKVRVDGNPIFNAMMGDNPPPSQATPGVKDHLYLDCHTKKKWYEEMDADETDRFGLPLKHKPDEKEELKLIEGEDSSNSGSSSEDEADFNVVQVVAVDKLRYI